MNGFQLVDRERPALREKIEQSRFVFQGDMIPVTISIGVAPLAESDKTGMDLIRSADAKFSVRA